MFWTLDLNGKRYIIKHHQGRVQDGGMRYLYWDGPTRGFEQKPVALSFISPSQPDGTTSPDESPVVPGKKQWQCSSPTDDSETSELSDPSDSKNDRRLFAYLNHGQAGARLLYMDDNNPDHHAGETPSTFQSPPAKKRKLESLSRQLYTVSPPAQQDRSSLRDYRPASPQSATSISEPLVNHGERKRKQRLRTEIEQRLERDFNAVFTPWAGEDQDVSRHTLRAIWRVVNLMEDNSPGKIARDLNKAVNGGNGKREPAGGKKPTESCFKDLERRLQSAKAGTAAGGEAEMPSSSSGGNRQRLDIRTTLPGAGGATAQSVRPDPGSILSDNRHEHNPNLDQHISSSTVLSSQKQARTTLVVRVPPSHKYLPLKLNDCETSEAFYTKVLGAWELPKEKVAKVTVTFTWMDPQETMRTLVMNRHVEGCFTHLIEQVDEASVWAEAPEGKAKCLLDVNIVLKE